MILWFKSNRCHLFTFTPTLDIIYIATRLKTEDSNFYCKVKIMETYKRILQAISYVGVGSLFIHYADLTIPVLSIIIGSIFIAFGFLIVITAPIQKLPNWIRRVEGWLFLALYFATVGQLIILAVNDAIENCVLFYVLVAFIILIPIIQLIDLFIKRKR